jgi:hypothetical protein
MKVDPMHVRRLGPDVWVVRWWGWFLPPTPQTNPPPPPAFTKRRSTHDGSVLMLTVFTQISFPLSPLPSPLHTTTIPHMHIL